MGSVPDIHPIFKKLGSVPGFVSPLTHPPHVLPHRLRQAHEQGFKVLVYTVNEPAEIEQMIGWEVDGLFSDFPDRVLAIRDGT